MMKNSKKGFTLIELLVVIAIIGILSAVVLASLSNARAKANDAKAKGQISSIRSAAELYYSDHGDYGGTASTCTTGSMFPDTTSGIAALVTQANYPSGDTLACFSSNTAWAVSAKLSPTAGAYFCSDSTGRAASTTAAASSTVCP
jgi:prepilin-type N-terminal cleavage/methylation domain-containing protein